MEQSASVAQIAMEIVEHSPSVAVRLCNRGGRWHTLFITENISGYGYAREDFLAGRMGWGDMIHPDDIPAVRARMEELAARGRDKYVLHYRVRHRQGRAIWVADSRTVTRDEAGEILYIDCIVADTSSTVEDRRKINDGLLQQQVLNEILQALQTAGPSEAFRIILGRTAAYLGVGRALLFEQEGTAARAVYEWTGKGAAALMEADAPEHEREMPEVAAALREQGLAVVQSGAVPPGCEAAFRRAGILATAAFAVHRGEESFGFVRFDECEHERAWPPETVAFLQNIAKLVSTAVLRKSNEDAIRALAVRDQLTGLANRYSLDAKLEKAITQARAAGKFGFVLFIDMDDFKVVNDGYGHDHGDALLLSVAEYLQAQFGKKAQLFRFGGDEFTILIDHKNAAETQAVIDELLYRARHPWQVMDREFYCTLSIGVMRFPDGAAGATEVVRNAEVAMYQAKDRGKNSYVFYNKKLAGASQQRAETEHRMREAIENRFAGFAIHYQPMVDVFGNIMGAEALVRWSDADGNLMPPAQFIPLAEYLGLIIPLGEFVLRDAAEQCRRINRQHPRFSMSVNVSMRQFQQPDFLGRVEAILNETGVEKSNMVLEVTEGMVVQDLDRMQMMLEQLRGMGLKIAMDDFGTGYSSLGNMRRLPLDIIKIDRSFIRDVGSDAYAKSFVRMIADLGHSIGCDVCVEGVETAAQHSYCVQCQVDSIQGFYFYRPAPATALEQALAAQAAPAAPARPPQRGAQPGKGMPRLQEGAAAP
ncbi:EAL domain-containing protein [Ruminococcaceae bacterium OttesenSCG-928-O06]|nr:EAL domain-containing protein [Ruminococcaceae bacterium OttesenSCG-928-O06]